MKSSFEGKQMIGKELEIKCPSGATISFTGEDSGESFKGLSALQTLLYIHNENVSKFERKTKYSYKQRKIHKLKRINCVLGQKRKRLITVAEKMFLSGKFNIFTINSYGCNVAEISEKIGKNSAKIQRLRTQIQQSKSLNTSEE